MSREIVEAIKGLEQEKGIDADTLMAALEDALLSAYKKTPGAAKYARVDLDRDTADFRVFELILPPELEEKLMAQAIEEQEQTIDPETGEMREPEDPELDPEIMAPYEDQITSRDVTPDDFGRIAAQTAKQVILQRIREAERHMMFEEYQDRVGELITGIIQQSDNRYTLVQLRERVEALLPRSEQVWNERYDHGMRVKAVITEVNAEGKGPGIVVSQAQPGADQGAVRARGSGDRRRPRRDRRRRPRARLPLEDRRHLARRRGRPGRRLRRPARLASADGRLRAARREDRHHPLQRGARPLRGEGALAGPRPRGAGRRRDAGGDGDRPRRPALAGDRPRGPERPPRRQAHRLEGRHQVRDRVQPGRGGADLRGRRGRRRPLRRSPLGRAPVPECFAPGLALLRPSAAPGARPLRHQPGDGALRPLRRRRSRCSPTRTPTTLRCGRSSSAPPPRSRRSRARRSPPRPRRPTEAARGGQGAGRGRRPGGRAGARGGRGGGRRGGRPRPRSPSSRCRSRRPPRRSPTTTSSPRWPWPRTPRPRATSPLRRPPRWERTHPRNPRPRARIPRGAVPRVPKKRVHEIAKDQGLSSKEVLAALNAAGIEAKVAASSVEEADALKALQAAGADGAAAEAKPAAPAPKADGKKATPPEGSDSAPSKSAQSGAEARRGAGAAPAGGAAGGRKRRRVVIDSQASRREHMPQAPPHRPPRRRGGRRRRPLLEEPTGQAAQRGAGARGHQDRVGRHRARGGGEPQPRQRRGDQEADGARRDGHAHPDAARRDGAGPCGGARPEDRDRQRRRGGGRGARLRRLRRGPDRATAGGDDHGPRRPRQDVAAGRDPRDRGGRRRGRRDHPAHRRLPGAPERQAGSPSSTLRATRRSRRCALAAPRSPTSP